MCDEGYFGRFGELLEPSENFISIGVGEESTD